MDYLYHIFVLLGIYTILTLAANIPVGLTNLLTMAQASFYGTGAYLSAYILMNFDLPVSVIFIIVALLTAVLSLVVSIASIRLKEDYFILATLGFQSIVFAVLYNWTDVTRGPFGIPGIDSPKLLGIFEISSNAAFAVFSLVSAALVAFLFHKLSSSPYGRALRAIRSDELSVQVLGRNTSQMKIVAFALSAGFSALAGFIFAGYVRYIDPTSFTLDESIFILCALFIGGLGNVKGCVAGAAFVVLLPELLRFAGLPDAIAANMRQIIYGLSLILVMRYFPKGLAGNAMLK